MCIFALTLTVVSMISPSARAQVPISVGGLDLTASSDAPIPGQTVTITARSYIIDINTARITWVVDGSTKQNGVGLTTLEVKAPALGKKISITVTASTPEGRVVHTSIEVTSGSIDFITETDGYVPPFFRGKLSPVYQNSIKIVAIPHLANAAGVEYDPKKLVYQWKRNDRVLEDQSGYGKQSITLVGDIVPRAYDIRVTAWSQNSDARTQGLTQISFGAPQISFYVHDPLYGPLFNKEIGESLRIGVEKETSVIAVPFGFNTSIASALNSAAPLAYSWFINNIKHAELSSSGTIVLRAPDGEVGDSSIRLDIANLNRILQGTSAEFTASFSAKQDASDESVTF